MPSPVLLTKTTATTDLIFIIFTTCYNNHITYHVQTNPDISPSLSHNSRERNSDCWCHRTQLAIKWNQIVYAGSGGASWLGADGQCVNDIQRHLSWLIWHHNDQQEWGKRRMLIQVYEQPVRHRAQYGGGEDIDKVHFGIMQFRLTYISKNHIRFPRRQHSSE